MHKYKEENLYIAGPECFYPDGFTYLAAMRREAEYYGFGVSLPNDSPLKTDHSDRKRNADAIFENCRKSMLESTAIIADLENFRGSEPDGGTVYELGMAYALGLRCYAYTRDKRDSIQKYQGAVLKENILCDREGRTFPYPELPFSPCIVGSSKITEGDFGDCLKLLMTDLEEERKLRARADNNVRKAGSNTGSNTDNNIACNTGSNTDSNINSNTESNDSAKASKTENDVILNASRLAHFKEKPLIYLAGRQRYDQDTEKFYSALKKICSCYGYAAVSPIDKAPQIKDIETDDPYTLAYHTFDHWQQHVRDCDIIIADLNDFHGMEPNSDVAFECGMAWQLGKKCYGFMEDTTVMRERIPHYGKEKNHKDICGHEVEHFDYPINLMFASSMPVLEGDFESVLNSILPQEG